jgi:molybdopterin molybdotransferase
VTDPLQAGQHIRKQGAEIKVADVLMKRGEKITARALGCLASAGISDVSVFAKPKVCIIPTGSELALPGEALSRGQIYESNSLALKAAISELGIEAQVLPIQRDDQVLITSTLSKVFPQMTHVMVAGGISVGEYDFVKKSFAECQVEEVFWKVAQKPGKPLFFGVRNGVNVFGLPGNPASSLVCFYEYIRAALIACQRGLDVKVVDVTEWQLKSDRAILCEPVNKKKNLTYFMRGKTVSDGEKISVMVLPQQDSHMMQSFLKANCLVILPATEEFFDAGTCVKIHWLPDE